MEDLTPSVKKYPATAAQGRGELMFGIFDFDSLAPFTAYESAQYKALKQAITDHARRTGGLMVGDRISVPDADSPFEIEITSVDHNGVFQMKVVSDG